MTQRLTPTASIRILFVAASPEDEDRLALDEEIREITQKMRATSQRDLFTFHHIWAARPRDLLQALNQFTPHIVHFSGHGNHTGELIFLDDQRNARPVDEATLRALFTTLKDNIRVVVLNACHSQKQARAITNVIDCAIGMQTSITDRAAIVFTSSFYQALGFGRSVRDAFEQGTVALQLEGIAEHQVPRLILKASVDPYQMYLIHDSQQEQEKQEKQRIFSTIEDALRNQHYHSAYQETAKLLRGTSYQLTTQEQARAKYLAALAHLNGKRPVTQSPSVFKQAEELLQEASNLHNLPAYTKILALIKQDFAKNGVQANKHRQEAQKLLNYAKGLHDGTLDQDIVELFACCQAQLFQENRHLLSK